MKASTGALKKIQVLMGSLSDSEKKLAEYLRLEREKIPFLSIYDVAKNAGVSTATVSRFVRKVGYKNFTELKIGIARDTDDSLQEIFSAINPDDSDEKIIQKVFHGNIKSIEDTYNIISIENLIKFAKAIAHSKRVLCIGIGGSGNVARDAALRLSHLNIQAEAYTDYYQILVQSLRTDKDTVVLGISHSGRSSITVEGLKLAKSKNAITGGISNYPDSPLSKVADFFFCTSFPETGVKVAALSSRIAQLCLIDAMYLLVARYRKNLWDVKKLNNLTDKLLRNK
ncbi:MAG TPA: MurR/RpiR family transcriptional regulator [Candidatus Ratteibacteria bacterium]|jgi:DNA-binding MurR/RpiR family transcriptional regulator|uniref:HTH-type transcriptional regulator YbbH n=1 Tax=candidate division TA06 bacterium ADurb.Bin131 TaxID=1852827 RepID=A0A1V6C9C9_UNCT6|nr:MAG: putative HTH-type transcriptional regulator YbbH [candidate division TA06 bacterium ADurb.Bin131]HON05119.1 MurR/RpiR family transcriptional regulator [bacterium]HRS05692.1 MurR/RpiR family transcriptional regulator [Candidatus Ratteibacteria bacterium]HPC28735.1 MurR/RpiR family transcriptional regulator [bacterium]HQL65088.1 MurR/RpiR family transcriptional regulator [bacterium]